MGKKPASECVLNRKPGVPHNHSCSNINLQPITLNPEFNNYQGRLYSIHVLRGVWMAFLENKSILIGLLPDISEPHLEMFA